MSNARPGTGLQLFDVAGNDIRFGTAEDGRPYAVAADFAKAMGYRDADKATRLLDEDEKGTQIVGTPGGPQQMNVIYEDGLWELIFRSTLPGAGPCGFPRPDVPGEVCGDYEGHEGGHGWWFAPTSIPSGGA